MHEQLHHHTRAAIRRRPLDHHLSHNGQKTHIQFQFICGPFHFLKCFPAAERKAARKWRDGVLGWFAK